MFKRGRGMVVTAAALLMATAGVAAPASARPGPVQSASAGTPKQIECGNHIAGRIVVHPPGDDGTGKIVGVAKWYGNGEEFYAKTFRYVWPWPEEVGYATGPSDGTPVYIPTRVTQPGRYFTRVTYYNDSKCDSQHVDLG